MYNQAIRESDLLFQIKLLRDRVKEFENGEKYLRMKEDHRLARSADKRKRHRLEKELERSRKETIHVRELWYATCQEIEIDCEKKLAAKDKEIEGLRKQLAEADERYVKECDAHKETKKELETVKKELEEEQEKSKSLKVRLNKDYHNSSKSSSMSPNHKTIHNGREKSGRNPGGQKGHLHHGRKPQNPTKDGYNLFKRMYENMEDYVLFLRDASVAPTNNDAERAGRKVKRKAHQVMSFRSLDGLAQFCDGLTIIEFIRGKDENLFEGVTRRFDKMRES